MQTASVSCSDLSRIRRTLLCRACLPSLKVLELQSRQKSMVLSLCSPDRSASALHNVRYERASPGCERAVVNGFASAACVHRHLPLAARFIFCHKRGRFPCVLPGTGIGTQTTPAEQPACCVFIPTSAGPRRWYVKVLPIAPNSPQSPGTDVAVVVGPGACA